MDVAIAGGHGKVGLQLGKLPVAQGHRARGLIRNPGQAGDLRAAGVEPILCDLEGDEGVAAAVAEPTPSSSLPVRGPAAAPSASGRWTWAAL